MPVDDGDILGLALSGAGTAGGQERQERDTDMVADAPPRHEGIFGSLRVDELTEAQISGVLRVQSMGIDNGTVTRIISETARRTMGTVGTAKSQLSSVIPKMVSEACKIYIHEMIELGVEDGADFVEADSIISTKYGL